MTEKIDSIEKFVEAIHQQSVEDSVSLVDYLNKSEYYANEIFKAAMLLQIPCAVVKLLPNEHSVVQILKLLDMSVVNSVCLVFVNDKLCIPCGDDISLQVEDDSLTGVLRVVNEDNFGQLNIDSKVTVANYPLDMLSFDSYFSKMLV